MRKIGLNRLRGKDCVKLVKSDKKRRRITGKEKKSFFGEKGLKCGEEW